MFQVGAAAVPALRHVPTWQTRHVDDDFADIALDQVPTGHKTGAEPVVQYVPARQDTHVPLDVAPDNECDLPASHGLGRMEPTRQKNAGTQLEQSDS